MCESENQAYSLVVVPSNELTGKELTEKLIQRYQLSTKNAVENILNMGEAVYEIYRKNKAKELSKDDLQYFCDSVGLDSKQSTFRKYKAIGKNASQFRDVMNQLPSSFSVLYEMATLSGEDFEKFVIKYKHSKSLTLIDFKRMVNKSSVLTKNKMINPPALQISSRGVSKLIKQMNRFTVDVARDIPESKFNELVSLLTEYRNKGWINFEYPLITEYVIEEDEKEFNDMIEDAQLSGDYSKLA